MSFVEKILQEKLIDLEKNLETLSQIVDYQTAFNKDVQAEIDKQTEEKRRIRDQQIAQAETAFNAHYETIKAKVVADKKEHLQEYQKRADEAMPQYEETMLALAEVKNTLDFMSSPSAATESSENSIQSEQTENSN